MSTGLKKLSTFLIVLKAESLFHAVSYTHLDVYKRQCQQHAIASGCKNFEKSNVDNRDFDSGNNEHLNSERKVWILN